ncbi:putative pectate lyase 4, partial [Bienertia sinuspersici]
FPQPQPQTSSSMAITLPYSHVDSCLCALAHQAQGFRRCAIGGLHRPIFCVTTLSDFFCVAVDDGPGSLREACCKKEPLWFVLEVSGTIELRSYLTVSSYKTIDGHRQRIKFTKKTLRLKEHEHVIICNLEFEGRRGHDVDGIQIKPNSKHIWIDRCTMRDYDDGLIDITGQTTDITISNSIYTQCNIYEPRQKKTAFLYYTEKVNSFLIPYLFFMDNLEAYRCNVDCELHAIHP